MESFELKGALPGHLFQLPHSGRSALNSCCTLQLYQQCSMPLWEQHSSALIAASLLWRNSAKSFICTEQH